jgi:peptide/nickel transport system permease protein
MGESVKRLRHVLRENPQLVWGGTIISLLLLVCIIGAFTPYDPVVERTKGIQPLLLPRAYYHYKLSTMRNAPGVTPACSNHKSILQRAARIQAYKRRQRRKQTSWGTSGFSLQGQAPKKQPTKDKAKKPPPEVAPHPNCVIVARLHQALPKANYWLGTDSGGQSILMRLLKGTEAFFFPGMMASLIALLGGVLFGAFAGFYGGWIELVSRYIGTVINSFPNLILVLLCITIFGSSMTLVAAIVGITFIPHIAEEIRRKVAQLKAEEFVMAAEAHGLRERTVLFYHIIWLHCLPMLLRQLVFLWGFLILLETSLNYLSRGVLLKGFSWGELLYEYNSGLFREQYWAAFVMTGVVMLTMSGVYFLAEGLKKWNDGAGRHIDTSDESPNHKKAGSSSAQAAPAGEAA